VLCSAASVLEHRWTSWTPWGTQPYAFQAAHPAAAHKTAKTSTLVSLLGLPYIRAKFINALPEWLHHDPSHDAHELGFFETEDAMKVRGAAYLYIGDFHIQLQACLFCRCGSSRMRTRTRSLQT
jgi:hypothetical protein